MTHSPALVWLYKANTSDELRYSMRSLTRNLKHSDVWVIGDRPRWYTGEHLATSTAGDFRRNTIRQMRMACESVNITDPFIYANDDFFALTPTDVPNVHRGTCADVYAERIATGHNNGYVRGIKHAETVLAEYGIDNPLCYELHVPMLIHKQAMMIALDICEQWLDDCNPDWLPKRTIYGNLASLGGTHMDDVKIKRPPFKPPHEVWLSTDETSFRKFEPALRRRVPEPSMWERRGGR